MKYISIKGNKPVYFGTSTIFGELAPAYEQEYIEFPVRRKYHQWLVTLPKDEQGQPVKPDLGVETYQVDGELEKQIQAYLDENGEDAIGEIVFDPDGPGYTIDESVKSERVNVAALSVLRMERDSLISSVEWMYNRHDRENRLNLETTLTDAQITELDNYVGALCDLPANTKDLGNPVWPDKPDFV